MKPRFHGSAGRGGRPSGRFSAGFTLLELMIVIGIAAVMMTVAVPFVGGVMNRRPIVQATNDILNVLGQARAQAILKGRPAVVRIFPREGIFTALPAGVLSRSSSDDVAEGIASDFSGLSGEESLGKPVATAQLNEDIVLEMVDVNFLERKLDETAEAVFYPNGTCDQLTIIFQLDSKQWRKISLDVITGMASFEVDPNFFE